MSWLGLLARLLPHADKLDDLYEQLRIVFDPESTIAQRGAALAAAIAILTGVLETVVAADADSEESVVTALKLGDGKLIALLKKLYDSGLLDLLIGLKG